MKTAIQIALFAALVAAFSIGNGIILRLGGLGQ